MTHNIKCSDKSGFTTVVVGTENEKKYSGIHESFAQKPLLIRPFLTGNLKTKFSEKMTIMHCTIPEENASGI